MFADQKNGSEKPEDSEVKLGILTETERKKSHNFNLIPVVSSEDSSFLPGGISLASFLSREEP